MYWGLPHMTSTIERGGGIQKADKRRGGFVILYMKRVEGINDIRKYCGRQQVEATLDSPIIVSEALKNIVKLSIQDGDQSH